MFTIRFGYLDNRDIEGATTKVINSYCGIATLFVHTIGKSCCSWLVDDTFYIQSCDLTCILGRLTLGIIKVSRDGYHGFFDFLAKKILCGLFHLHKDLCRNLRRRHFLTIYLNPGITIIRFDDFVGHHLDILLYDFILVLTPNQALDREQGVTRISHRLALGRLTNQCFSIVAVCNDGGSGTISFRIFNDFGLASFHHGDTGVGSSQIDTNNLTHYKILRLLPSVQATLSMVLTCTLNIGPILPISRASR